MDAQRRRILPLVIPGIGIANVPFGQLLLELREEAGLRNDGTDVPFLPAPRPDGSWSSDPLSSSEITRWLRHLLPRPASEKPLSSHSLKVTTLMWCSKFGMLRETKRVLGHHADAATGSDAVYGRELQSAALREYVLILEAVASGKFFPDQTRSGHFAPGWSREDGTPTEGRMSFYSRVYGILVSPKFANIISMSHDCFQLADGGHFGASLFFFFGRGVGLLWPASVLLPLRAQIGISCFCARLPFLLHLLHEIECGFIGSIRSSDTYSLTCLEAKM